MTVMRRRVWKTPAVRSCAAHTDIDAAERPDGDGLVGACPQPQRRAEASPAAARTADRRPAAHDLDAAPGVPRDDRVAEASDGERGPGLGEVSGAPELERPAEAPAVGPDRAHDRQVAAGLCPARRRVATLVDPDLRVGDDRAAARERLDAA
jgi:hypothetical protein